MSIVAGAAHTMSMNARERPHNSTAKRGVVYLLTGPAHGPRLIVSMWSLRHVYDGPITLFTTRPESHRIGQWCAADPMLRVEHRPFKQVRARKNSTLLTKVAILPQAPYDVGVFLDADTLISGEISELFEMPEDVQMNAVQFAQWHTAGRIMRKRLERWRNLKQDRFDEQWLDRLVDHSLNSRPAVNVGVFGFRRDAPLLSQWLQLATAGQRTFICDEIACQLLLPHYPHRILDCRFNCSPIHAAGQRDVRVWHFHGDKHLSRSQCRDLWWPAYRECLDANIARLAEWTPGDDKYLRSYLHSIAPASSDAPLGQPIQKSHERTTCNAADTTASAAAAEMVPAS